MIYKTVKWIQIHVVAHFCHNITKQLDGGLFPKKEVVIKKSLC